MLLEIVYVVWDQDKPRISHYIYSNNEKKDKDI